MEKYSMWPFSLLHSTFPSLKKKQTHCCILPPALLPILCRFEIAYKHSYLSMPLGKLPHRGEELFTILARHDWKERLCICLCHSSTLVDRDNVDYRSHCLLLYHLAGLRRCLTNKCFSL